MTPKTKTHFEYPVLLDYSCIDSGCNHAILFKALGEIYESNNNQRYSVHITIKVEKTVKDAIQA
jgi:hypothetical protein